MTIAIRQYETGDVMQVIQLWTNCDLIVPWNNPHRDIQRKFGALTEFFLVGCLAYKIVATFMAGYDGHRGWINYLAVRPDHQHAGIARRMMDEAETLLRAAGCPKINLQVRRSNTTAIEFYKKIGYRLDDHRISKNISLKLLKGVRILSGSPAHQSRGLASSLMKFAEEAAAIRA